MPQSSDDRMRQRSQANSILAMLRAAGERGCTNGELWAVAHAAHSRIADLRARGHRIHCVCEAPGLYRYTLEPSVTDGPSPSLLLIPTGVTLPLFDGICGSAL